jgi:hypothetical protein
MTARRWRATDAFVDESVRGGRYVVACVLTDARDLPQLRSSIIGLLRPHQRRLHFHRESPGRRRALIASFATMAVRLVVVSARMTYDRDEEAAREARIGRIVSELQTRSVERLVLESRDDDRHDARTIIRARLPAPALLFEHRAPLTEPLLWLTDGVAWTAGLGGEQFAALQPIIDRMFEIRP